MQTLTEPAMKAKPFEAGDGIEFKILDDKILISAQGTTRIREGNFLLQGKEIIIEAGKGIKISSRTPNVLVIEANTTKQDEIIYDLKKAMDELKKSVDTRLEIIERGFSKILKTVKL